MLKKGITFLLILLLLFTFSGCGSEQAIVDDATTAYTDTYGGEIIDSRIDKYSSSMSENHSMMIALILNNKGMSYELDDYDDLYLIFLTDENNEEHAIVSADGEILVP
ncbi:MAG: hypothetical protein JJE03_05455 [Peptostreptococcaceae bacterium]|nr:hypothetical protein [Peptostreptococcaceae bacterium]